MKSKAILAYTTNKYNQAMSVNSVMNTDVIECYKINNSFW